MAADRQAFLSSSSLAMTADKVNWMDGLRGNKGKGDVDLKEWNTKGGRGGMDSRAEQQQLDELHAAWVMPGFRTTKAAMHSRFTCKLQQ